MLILCDVRKQTNNMARMNGPKALFKKDGKKYVAQLIGHKSAEAFFSPNGDFHQGIAMFIIMDELQEKELGGIMFTTGPLVKAIWSNFDNTSKEYFDNIDDTTSVLVNLLNHLPLNLDNIPTWFHGTCFEYRFDSQANEGLEVDRSIFNINSTGGVQQNIRRWVLGEDFVTQDVQKEMKNILWNLYELNQDVGMSVNRFAKILGLSEDIVKNHMRRLVDAGLAIPTARTDQTGIISIKAAYELIEDLEGGGKKPMTQHIEDNRKYIQIAGSVTAHKGSSINLSVEGDIHQEFEKVANQIDSIEKLSSQEKKEIKMLVQTLDLEMAGKKDENKIVGIIKKIGNISSKAFEKLTDNSTIAPFLTYYLAKAAGVPLP